VPGHRGHGVDGTEIIIARQKRGITRIKRKRQKRRNAVEPIIGHCKNDRKVGPRNWLHGQTRGSNQRNRHGHRLQPPQDPPMALFVAALSLALSTKIQTPTTSSGLKW